MTKDEIKALIDKKIKGQGTNIDGASVLPTILDAIIDLIPTKSNILESLSVHTELTAEELVAGSDTGLSKEAACEALGIGDDDFASLFNGAVVKFFYVGGSLAVGSQTPSAVVIGDVSAFSITIEYDSETETYDVTAAIA